MSLCRMRSYLAHCDRQKPHLAPSIIARRSRKDDREGCTLTTDLPAAGGASRASRCCRHLPPLQRYRPRRGRRAPQPALADELLNPTPSGRSMRQGIRGDARDTWRATPNPGFFEHPGHFGLSWVPLLLPRPQSGLSGGTSSELPEPSRAQSRNGFRDYRDEARGLGQRSRSSSWNAIS